MISFIRLAFPIRTTLQDLVLQATLHPRHETPEERADAVGLVLHPRGSADAPNWFERVNNGEYELFGSDTSSPVSGPTSAFPAPY